MKKILVTVLAVIMGVSIGIAQTKKDGTPDMRYKANKQTYSNTPSTVPKTSTQRNYTKGGEYHIQSGYRKSNGTYVAPHLKTKPDNVKWNNAKP